jgi:hypothetical protein
MDSIAEGDDAPDIGCSRGDLGVSDLVLGRTPDSLGAKGQLGRMSLRFRQQQPGEAVGESGNCSFTSMERARESADHRGNELIRTVAMPALKRAKIIPESKLSGVSAAPRRQSPLFRKGSARHIITHQIKRRR